MVSPVDRSALLPVLVADLPDVLSHVAEVLQADWPDYADFLSRHRDEVASAGQSALEQFVEVVEQARESDGPLRLVESVELAVFEEIGRAQWRAGRQLPSLLTAYQAGAQVAWRRFARSAGELGLPASDVALLAEAVFAFVDGLSSASARGYVEEQTGAAEERQRARAELADLLLSGRSDPATVQAAAERAGWRLPDRVALLLVDDADPLASEALTRLGVRCLPLRRPDAVGVLVPYPDAVTGERRLSEVLRGVSAVVAPPVPLERLPKMLQVLRVALRLVAEGVLTGSPVVVADHLDAVIVHRDARLLEALRTQVLQPLAELPADTRERLEETLDAWLRHMGNQQAVAAELHVHRQTVRYRLAQLRELFGEVLDSPAGRLQLTLAVAWGSPGEERSVASLPRPRRERRSD